MIAFLRGFVVDTPGENVIVDVGGIGYEVMLHQRALSQLPPKGKEVVIFTRMITGENDLRLFGFLDRSELELFKVLTSVSGLGPKTALSILGILAPGPFYRAVASGDARALMQVPGVGKKTAERVLFELKDKIPTAAPLTQAGGPAETEELLEALVALGFSRSEVYPDIVALIERNEYGSLEDNLKAILKRRSGAKGTGR